MEPDWQRRGMFFSSLGDGDLGMMDYARLMMKIGYPERYCKIMGSNTAPLVVEAEDPFRDGDDTSAAGIAYVGKNLCFPVAAGSFEDGMGAAGAERTGDGLGDLPHGNPTAADGQAQER